MVNKRVFSWFAVCVLFGALFAQGADFWEKKPFMKWSLKECRKLLQKSPWAKSRTFSSVHIDPLQAGPVSSSSTDPLSGAPGAGAGGVSDVGARSREQNPRLIYQVQFRTALPIRQAMVRIAMIQANYDKLDEGQKQAFDAKVKGFLSASYPDRVIVHVSFQTNVHQDFLDLSRHWRVQTVDTLKNTVFLLGVKGRKVSLEGYAFAEGAENAFQFVFPRTIDGEPLVGSKDKSLQLEFMHPNIRNQGAKRILLSFKVKDLLMDGELVF